MRKFNRLSSGSFKSLLITGTLLLPAMTVLGDTVYLQSTGTGKPLQRANVTINKVAKDPAEDAENLYWTTNDSGRTEHKPVDKVVQIEADNEPAFNQAEAEFAKDDLKAAGEDYRRAISASSKDWVKRRSSLRLVGISAKIGDFLGAVAGYVEMVRKDPGTSAQKPAIDAAKPEQLSAAATTVSAGVASASTEAKLILLPYLAEIQNKAGDTAGAGRTLAALKAIHPAAVVQNPAANKPVATDNTGDMAVKQVEADNAITKANSLMASKDYAGVITTINAASAAFVDPDHQARALYLLAEAKYASAATPEAQEEAAMAYMRVVAHFRTSALAADALYKTGIIEEKLNKQREAKLIYGQVVSEYPTSKAAEEAKAHLK